MPTETTIWNQRAVGSKWNNHTTKESAHKKFGWDKRLKLAVHVRNAVCSAVLSLSDQPHYCKNVPDISARMDDGMPEKMHAGWPASKSNIEGFTIHPKPFCRPHKVVRHSQTESRFIPVLVQFSTVGGDQGGPN